MARYRMLFLATAAALLAHRASAQDAQVMHWWTSGGESRAIAVFAKEYEKRGGKWIDGASVGPQAEHAAVLNAIAGGNPPAAFQWNIGVAVRQLAEQGLLANLDDMASAGDWAKGDFSAAGMTVGKEYGCLPAPGTQDAYVMTVDVFAFPKVTKPDQIAAQRKLAELMMDPAVQVEFNKFKGSLPARLDADVGSLDACAQLGQKVMAGGDANQLPNFALAFGPDTQGQIEDLLIHYWSTPSMPAADATKEFSTIIANAAS